MGNSSNRPNFFNDLQEKLLHEHSKGKLIEVLFTEDEHVLWHKIMLVVPSSDY